MLAEADLEALRRASHPDPFAVLGPHRSDTGDIAIRVFIPGAERVTAVALGSRHRKTLQRRADSALFEAEVAAEWAWRYRLKIKWQEGGEALLDDPYRFGTLLADTDLWLFAEGTLRRPCEVLGARACVIDGVVGTRFAVWAPQASRVSVVGDFNHWDGRRHPMRRRHPTGIWEIFLPGVAEGARYKYELRDAADVILPQKTDPYALQAEMRPATASIVAPLPSRVSLSAQRQQANARDAPISIYEVHAGSWRRPAGGDRDFFDWDALAAELVPYVSELGFTHVELMPITEHPFDGSWGYQPIGLYAPTARHGDAAGFRRFVECCHAAGLGVLLDWVPAHFPADAHGLARFDGSALYEYADPREGVHRDWNTLIYDFAKPEVRGFLIGSALHWLERFGIDGLRVDAVASMLYRDYSRPPGEWLPNVQGGRENLEAIAFLRQLNEVVGAECPGAVTIAEESTAFPGVSRPTYAGGLGFHYKWNMGWMNDSLRYIARDPIYRRYHQGELAFGLVYAFSENFVLPVSHDEVVHGKGSLLGRMPGDAWQRFANLRAYLGFMFAHPGKKLLFMGCEIAQPQEWTHDGELAWSLLQHPEHRGVQHLVRDLNQLYRSTPALYELDTETAGFEWLIHDDATHSVYAFLRRGRDPKAAILAVCNFTPTPHEHYRIGVPGPGTVRECLNTDAACYGGSNVGNASAALEAEPHPAQDRAWSITLRLPPLAVIFAHWEPR
ncbi:MAG: 1,4-alpha-glucan branching protein GlgB [Nevskiaceae bacterium]